MALASAIMIIVDIGNIGITDDGCIQFRNNSGRSMRIRMRRGIVIGRSGSKTVKVLCGSGWRMKKRMGAPRSGGDGWTRRRGSIGGFKGGVGPIVPLVYYRLLLPCVGLFLGGGTRRRIVGGIHGYDVVVVVIDGVIFCVSGEKADVTRLCGPVQIKITLDL
jgi:hypothetical protein